MLSRLVCKIKIAVLVQREGMLALQSLHAFAVALRSCMPWKLSAKAWPRRSCSALQMIPESMASVVFIGQLPAVKKIHQIVRFCLHFHIHFYNFLQYR
jgi:hypothetical protein